MFTEEAAQPAAMVGALPNLVRGLFQKNMQARGSIPREGVGLKEDIPAVGEKDCLVFRPVSAQIIEVE